PFPPGVAGGIARLVEGTAARRFEVAHGSLFVDIGQSGHRLDVAVAAPRVEPCVRSTPPTSLGGVAPLGDLGAAPGAVRGEGAVEACDGPEGVGLRALAEAAAGDGGGDGPLIEDPHRAAGDL